MILFVHCKVCFLAKWVTYTVEETYYKMPSSDSRHEKGKECSCVARRAHAYVLEIIKCQPARSVECLTGGFMTSTVSFRQPFSVTQSSRCCNAIHNYIYTHAHMHWAYTNPLLYTHSLHPPSLFLLVVTPDFVSLLPYFFPLVLWKISSYPLPGFLLGKLIWCVKFTNSAEGCAC